MQSNYMALLVKEKRRVSGNSLYMATIISAAAQGRSVCVYAHFQCFTASVVQAANRHIV